MSVSVFAAARHICSQSDWRVTNLKLQKVLYLAHMSFMGQNNGTLLIQEPFEAWDYGPVVRVLYDAVKVFGNSPIQDIFYGSVKRIDDVIEGRMLSSAWDHLKDRSAGELIQDTHWKQGAWAKNYKHGRNNLIPSEDILEEFVKRTGIIPQAHAA